ncbi:MAG: carbon-nitrogen hydrolase family protein [Oscillospiraceae bacterium]|nr:carbon-nitrogen hydrolase family protein [Oscillospiraceae bacterium]
MNSFKVALLQLMPTGTQAENMKKGIGRCRKAKEMGADIALFPEMWNCGYEIPQDKNKVNGMSVAENGEFVNVFGQLAEELDMAIAITFMEKAENSLPKNSVKIFDRKGNTVFKYSKVHTCDFGDECMLAPGDDFYTGTLSTGKGDVQIGAMICYDREFPESARILMLKGAEIILVPNACPMEINRLSQLRGRAYENMLGIATCNYPKGKPDCNGYSSAFDGVVYPTDGSGPRDTCILQADGSEGIFIADFDMDFIRDYRENEVHGNAYRRPDRYTILTEENVQPPFIRKDRRKW